MIDRVREPDVRPGPADRLGQLDRPLPVLLDAVPLFVDGLAQVRVEVNVLVLAGELGGRAHQLRCHRERRARREHDPRHRIARRIVVLADDALAVAQDRPFVFDRLVGR
jgi:hypothetical protein